MWRDMTLEYGERLALVLTLTLLGDLCSGLTLSELQLPPYKKQKEKQSVSYSVMSDFLRPHGL